MLGKAETEGAAIKLMEVTLEQVVIFHSKPQLMDITVEYC